jgi:ABC-type Fe3+/spermidine/putrescine transport system ATPase subunit
VPSIKLEKVCKYICRDVELAINDRELLVLLGPSGAGKTTLLNIIAGLTDYRGSVLFDGQRVDKLPASKRGVGYLFQDLFLFPHLDVTANIAYGLKAQRQARDGVQDRVAELLHLMKISHLAGRYPRQLSGGEKQRVALARALAPSPGVLLLDEPLSALDLRTAKYLRLELKRIHRELGLTTVHITHDLMEALEMADRVAIIQNGQLEQVAEPEEMLFYPEGEKVADFIGAPNILDCDGCRELGQGVMEVDCGGLKLTVPHEGRPVHKVAILPRHIYVSETRPPGLSVNGFDGTVIAIRPSGHTVKIWLDVGGKSLMAEIPSYINEEMDLAVGKQVFLILRMRRIRCYESNLKSFPGN